MDVLICLARNPGTVVTKQELLEAVWHDAFAADSGLARCVTELRQVLGDSAREGRVIETIPRKGYRLAAAVEPVAPSEESADALLDAAHEEGRPAALAADPVSPAHRPVPVDSGTQLRLPTGQPLDRRVRARLSAAGLAALAVVALWGASSKRAPGTEDTVLVTVVNTTGNPVFDRTLPLAVAVQLEKDASVHVLSEERTRELLPPGSASSDGAAAARLCRQPGATASITGSIAGRDGDLVLGLDVASCRSGAPIYHEVVHLGRPEHVLPRVRSMAAAAGRRLGEVRMVNREGGHETRA